MKAHHFLISLLLIGIFCSQITVIIDLNLLRSDIALLTTLALRRAVAGEADQVQQYIPVVKPQGQPDDWYTKLLLEEDQERRNEEWFTNKYGPSEWLKQQNPSLYKQMCAERTNHLK